MVDDYNSLKVENDSLNKRVSALEAELATYKTNGGVGLYYELNRIINMTVEHLRGKTIQSLMGSGEDSAKDKTFERTMALIKASKEHLTDLAEIKLKLGLSGDEQKDKQAVPFIEQIAETRK
jgi:hypothetical protein